MRLARCDRVAPHPAALGIALGIANLAFVAFAIVWSVPQLSRETFTEPYVTIVVLGFIPSVFAGALTGVIAGATRRWPLAGRLTVVCVVPLVLVYMLGHAFEMEEQIVPTLIPTAVAVLVLEKHTRHVDPPAIPPAITNPRPRAYE